MFFALYNRYVRKIVYVLLLILIKKMQLSCMFFSLYLHDNNEIILVE